MYLNILMKNFMNKIAIPILICNILFADSLSYYFFTIKEDYKEYSAGSIIDRDFNSFGDLNGIGIKYIKNYYYSDIYLITEASYGKSYYKGSYQNGTSIENEQYNVGIYNLKLGINTKFYLLELGYRFWNRGSSNSSSDYDEQYYWPYFALGLNSNLYFNSFVLKYNFKYTYALWPKLKIYLGNNPTINLGNTNGMEAEINFKKKINYIYSIGIFYKYVYWHINKSKKTTLIYNGNIYKIFEPESETRNQYIGIYLQKSF